MKKSIIALSALALVVSLGACKPKQSTYRQVYEKAKQREIAQNQSSNHAPEADENDIIVSKPAQSSVQMRREHGMIRVIVASFMSREEAVSSREQIKERFAPQFQDAWLLEREAR